MAKLYFRYGAMNSGKSSQLLQVAHNYRERGMVVLILKPSVDTKGDSYVVSRLGVKGEIDASFSSEDNLYTLITELTNNKKIDCVLIDEAQFMTKNQADQLLMITSDKNIPVICYGLRTDYRREGFEGASRLLLIAHSIEELKTICKCGKKAIFNTRLINGESVFDGEQIVIDNNDEVRYEAVCNECYNKYLTSLKADEKDKG